MLTLILIACAGKDAPVDTAPADAAPTWDAEAAAIDCAWGTEAPLLEAAMDDAGLSSIEEIGWDDDTWEGASYKSYLDDDFLLSWFRGAHWAPLSVQCLGGQAAADLDAAGAAAHPVAAALGEAMALADAPPGDAAPIDPAEASQELADLSSLPAELAAALVPVLQAMAEAHEVWQVLDDAAPNNTKKLMKYGHGGVLLDYESHPDLSDPEVQAWVLGDSGPRALYGPALRLAFAIEEADLGRFAGTEASLEVETALGLLIVAGPGSDAPGALEDVALYLDLGGDDTYTHPAGGTTPDAPIAIHIDLGGDDTYTYEETEAASGQLLPADEDGRYGGDGSYGRFSLSTIGRQGSGRFGIGLLFDLGGGADSYRSLRMSQGWGHLGVGVLYDDGGDDLYQAEAGAQGAASMGIGLLMDASGADVYETFTDSQGFAYTQAVGIAWDGGGGDRWFANPGKAEDGYETLYYSPQLPGNGNNSFAQGAGFGIRRDDLGLFLSGGIGILRDAGGDDAYYAGVFGQGTGYWQGTGLLLDGGGADTYDAYYYAQGGAAHYAIGALMDAGDGADQVNNQHPPNSMHLGAGHDFSVGLYVDGGGDDVYVYGGLAAGASNCQGVGIFADGGGDDIYQALSSYSTGLGNHSTECESSSRTKSLSVGLFLDSGGGQDDYDWIEGDERSPANDSRFGIAWNGAGDERGGAVDGDGATGVSATGAIE